MTKHEIFELASLDIAKNQAPFRSNGSFHFTPGLLSILNQSQYNVIRTLNSEITILEKKRQEYGEEMLFSEHSAKQYTQEYSEEEDLLKKDLLNKKQELELKKDELVRHREHLSKRGIDTTTDLENEPEHADATKPTPQPKWKYLKGMLSVLSIFLGIELIMLLIQWQVLRHHMSIDDLLIRTLGVLGLGFCVHLAGYLYQKNRKVLYVFAQWFCFAMFFIMVFAPVVLQHFYPESTSTSQEEVKLDLEDLQTSKEDRTPITNADDHPTWIQLHRNFNETMPILAGLMVFLGVFLYDHSSISRDATKPTSTKETKDSGTTAIPNPRFTPITVLRQLEIDERNLRKRIEQIEARIKQHKNNSSDISGLLKKLSSLKAKIDDLYQQIESKKIYRDQCIKTLTAEINVYKSDYLDILRGDPVKQFSLKPDWPSPMDVLNYF